ncbi:MAG: DUF4214 domain-containing protein [Clostridia bacterium]|nr:DUF4214 domain-containing protein [Clostridia bacterium]
MYKKLVSLILSIALCMSLMSTMAFAETYYIWINGEGISSSNLTVQCGEGTAKYNPTTNEVTLTNATLTYAIHSYRSFTLILEGDNSIVEDNKTLPYGINLESDELTIKGSGNLSINISQKSAHGILVSGGTLNIDMTGTLDIDAPNCIAGTSVNIVGSGKINLNSTGLEAIKSYSGGMTISGNNTINITSQFNGIHSENSLTLSGNNNIDIKAAKEAIRASFMDINNAGSITLNAENGLSTGNLTQKGSGPISITAAHNAIFAYRELNLLGDAKIDLYSKDCGILFYGDGTVTLGGNNNITISADTRGIYTEDLGKVSIIGNGNITIKDCNDYAIFAKGGIDINHEGTLDINAEYGLYGYRDVNISGKGNTSIICKETCISFDDDRKLIIENAGKVIISSSNDVAVSLGMEEGSVIVNGEVDFLSFSSAPSTKVIYSWDTNDCSIIVEKPDSYDVTGSKSENSLIYTLKTYSVSFDMGGHGTSIDNQTVTHNNNVTKPSDPVATGYKFDGWYTDKNFTKAFDFDTAITADTILYAKWSCPHLNTEIKNKKDATTTSTGYTGDTYCKDCGELVSSGAAIPTLTPAPTTAPTTAPTSAPTSAPTVAPELNVGDFINRCYSVALGRSADEAGYNYWVDNLNNGQACGAQVGYGFIFSQEYINKNRSDEEFVNDMYAMYFGREADSDGFNYWVGLLGNGLTREDIMAGFANSEEFYNLCNKYGVVCGTYLVGVPNDVQGGVNCFVARLYKVCLNRLPDMGGQAGWVLKLMDGDVSGTSAAYGFVFSPEFIGKNPSNEAFVNYMYAAFFGREADEAGFNAWVDVLNNGGSYEDVFAGFSGSAEFANLCASYGIQA